MTSAARHPSGNYRLEGSAKDPRRIQVISRRDLRARVLRHEPERPVRTDLPLLRMEGEGREAPGNPLDERAKTEVSRSHELLGSARADGRGGGGIDSGLAPRVGRDEGRIERDGDAGISGISEPPSLLL